MTEPDEVTFNAAIAIGLVLVVLGVVAYILTEFASVTALIPSIFGVLFVVLGWAGIDASRRLPVVYGLGLVALLGFGGSAQGLVDVGTIAIGGTVDQPIAAGSQVAMAICCLVVIVHTGRSILDRR